MSTIRNTFPKAPTPKPKKSPLGNIKPADPVKPYVGCQRLASPKMAPYDDYNDEDLYDLDLIRHPDGTVGRVVYLPDAPPPTRWMVLYNDGVLLPLHEQVTQGRAIRVGLTERVDMMQGRVVPAQSETVDD